MKISSNCIAQYKQYLRVASFSLLVFGSVSIGSETLRAQSLPETSSPAGKQAPSNTENASSPEAQAPIPSVPETVRLGDDRYAQADYKGAVEAYSQALQAYKLNAYALYNRANAYRQLEEYEAAIADYTTALQIAPDNLFAYLYRGMALYEQKQPAAAIADFSKVIELNPKHALAFQKRGESHLANDNATAAIQDLEQAEKLYEKEEKFRKVSQVQKKLKQAKSAQAK
ncbi:tetratricopeptide repeat protein [Acaryochloris marina NIES-2412]|uniref:tetratricopeptide repeat protein n=1 Tax=Acaryochloris marina TaxID=155978 RepID=UPI0040585271